MQDKNSPFADLANFMDVSHHTIVTRMDNYGENSLELNDGDLINILPVYDTVVMPEVPQPVRLLGEYAMNVAEYCFANGLPLAFATYHGSPDEPFDKNKVENIATVGKIVKPINLPDGTHLVLAEAREPVFLDKISNKKPFPMAKIINIGLINSPVKKKDRKEAQMMLETLSSSFAGIQSFLPEEEREKIHLSLEMPIRDLVQKLYGLVLSIPFTIEEKLNLLKAMNLYELILEFAKATDQVSQRLSLQASIHRKTHESLTSQQKEVFLRQQLKSIQEELGSIGGDSEIEELKARAVGVKWNKKAREYFDKSIKKLERLAPNSPDYSIEHSYINTLLELPWENYRTGDFTLSKVEKILDRDHYGLEKVKERILEHMAVIKLRKDLKSPILCFYGPPGVGKTSLGKSIAEAMGRDYARVSLGGLHDEAEIRGHRRTYIGAMPGRIISSLMKSGSGNPVFILDEIDKIRKDFKGDPSSALLEVLDPEQNSSFHDNFIDFDYDLSRVFFIATANDISEISRPLLDRMELIDINGYIEEEKIQIAKRHLISKALEENGFQKNEIEFDKGAISYIINHYTRESGVRQLEKKISKILRKIARLKASGSDYPVAINAKKAREFLGVEEVNPETYEGNDYAGVVTGLAWTQAGGEILFIETSLSPGKGEKLTLTGNLGDVMKESATIALEYAKAHGKILEIDSGLFENYNVHIHVPEGAVPKDGPSAGITIATSLISAFTGKRVRDKMAMSGELTLMGKVLPVGGIKEKILAAKRAGITNIVLSKDNKKNVEDINPRYLKGLTFHYVETLNDVVKLALLEEKAPKRFFLNEEKS